jgi:uncharacterized protein
MTGRPLLDINLLIALFDEGHVHHRAALKWWAREGGQGWASCPLTQNGVVRIMSGATYPRPLAATEVLQLLADQIAEGGHEFWPDDVSLTDETLFVRDRILGPRRLTDIYLLALAVRHDGRLATFDRRISLSAVRGAEPRHLVVI